MPLKKAPTGIGVPIETQRELAMVDGVVARAVVDYACS
jgi:hypothetical protein